MDGTAELPRLAHSVRCRVVEPDPTEHAGRPLQGGRPARSPRSPLARGSSGPDSTTLGTRESQRWDLIVERKDGDDGPERVLIPSDAVTVDTALSLGVKMAA